MTLDRRQLLASVTSLAAGAAALPLLPGPRAAGAAEAPAAAATFRSSGEEIDWRAVRAEFDGLAPDWTHLASFLFVSHPRALRAEIERFRARIDSDPVWIEEAMYAGIEGRPYERAREAVAEYAGALPQEIAFTSNTTSAIALFYHGLKIRRDQEIVVTTHDHFVHHQSAQFAVERSGASLRYVPLYDRSEAADAGEIVRRVERAITAKTRALGVTWVHSSTGVKLPVAGIAEAVARANRGRAAADRCLLFVDGVHGFGNQRDFAAKLGADFFATATHKWFHGPRGTGFLWGREGSWNELRPLLPSFDPHSESSFVDWMEGRRVGEVTAAVASPGGFLAYEHFLALPVAAELHRALGRERVAARIAELNGAMREGLAKIPGVTLRTPRSPELSAGISCFEVAGVGPRDVVARLGAKKIRATTSPYKISYARLAAGILNLPEEIDRALAAVREIARG